MKKSFILIEFVIVIILLGIIYSVFIPKKNISKLDEVTNRILIYLNFTRFKALSNDIYSEEQLWHKKRWTMKFFRCRESEGGGIYFSIYSEDNDTGHPNQRESLKDPLTNKYIYSSNYCRTNNENSKFVLLKNYDIKDVNISCNNTTSLGQISFGEDGKIYSRLSNLVSGSYEYEIKNPCIIKFISNSNDFREIIIHQDTGFIELLSKK
ncbi:type II secretion system protein [Arcobacter lanthieri]|uniref:type II secretion system protein n=1 Tax=Aliarcobacter lanthieri TaxID=1355374 RepID=UPI0019208D49|nr:type II secretion system protein [Aliarcobacter lanthieri]MBL3519708.1 type II secretion system protein [Aliarcobacter lanthieri]